MKTYCPLLFINKRIPFKKKSIAVALLFVGSSTISHAVEWEKEFVIESDVSWNEMVGGGGQAHQRSVKIIENIPVFVVDGAVRLVTDYKVKVPNCEQLALVVLHRVDAVHHGLIGGEHTVGGIVVLLLAEIGN